MSYNGFLKVLIIFLFSLPGLSMWEGMRWASPPSPFGCVCKIFLISYPPHISDNLWFLEHSADSLYQYISQFVCGCCCIRQMVHSSVRFSKTFRFSKFGRYSVMPTTSSKQYRSRKPHRKNRVCISYEALL
jgi:hypothetical protein